MPTATATTTFPNRFRATNFNHNYCQGSAIKLPGQPIARDNFIAFTHVDREMWECASEGRGGPGPPERRERPAMAENWELTDLCTQPDSQPDTAIGQIWGNGARLVCWLPSWGAAVLFSSCPSTPQPLHSFVAQCK